MSERTKGRSPSPSHDPIPNRRDSKESSRRRHSRPRSRSPAKSKEILSSQRDGSRSRSRSRSRQYRESWRESKDQSQERDSNFSSQKHKRSRSRSKDRDSPLTTGRKRDRAHSNRHSSPSSSPDRKRSKHSRVESHKKKDEKRSKHKKQKREKKRAKEEARQKKVSSAASVQAPPDMDIDSDSDSDCEFLIQNSKLKVDPPAQADDGELRRKEAQSGRKHLTSEDYFRYHSEFAHWLNYEKKIMFNELNSTQSRKLFNDFVGAWNAGLLCGNYWKQDIKSGRAEYKWVGVSQSAASSLTSQNSSEREKRILQALQSNERDEPPPSKKWEPLCGPEMSAEAIRNLQRDQKKDELKRARKQLREQERVIQEEISPKETGRAAMVAKRTERRELRKGREVSPEYDDATLLGGGDEYQLALRRFKSEQEQRQKKRARASADPTLAQRVEERQKKEDETMEYFKNIVRTGFIPLRDQPQPK